MTENQEKKFTELMRSHPDNYSADYISEQLELIKKGDFTHNLCDSACWAYNKMLAATRKGELK